METKDKPPYILKWRVFLDDSIELRGDASIHRTTLSNEEIARRFFRCVVRRFIAHKWKCHIQLWRRDDHFLLAEFHN